MIWRRPGRRYDALDLIIDCSLIAVILVLAVVAAKLACNLDPKFRP